MPAARDRARELFVTRQRARFARTDRLFAVLMIVQFCAGIAAALSISPRRWAGSESGPHLHVWLAILAGGALAAYPVFLAWTRPGERITRHAIAAAQMMVSALLIHLTGGRIETHFHVFGSLAFLSFYRDRSVLVTAAAVIIADHLVRGAFWPQSVFGVMEAPLWRSFEHAGWVAFELAFLCIAIRQSREEMRTIARRQVEVEEAHEGVEQLVRERTSELREAERKTRAILESAADGIISTCPNGVVSSFNPAAEALFDLDAAEVVGTCVGRLVPPPDGVEPAVHLRGDGGIRVVTGRRQDGTTFDLELAVTESDTGFIAIARDVTARSAVGRMKTEFISTVSHELRTPLTSIRGSLGLLDGGVAGQLPDKAGSLIEIALKSTERLVRLVNDILDIEKIASGEMEMQRVPVSLDALVGAAIAATEAVASQQGVGIAVTGSAADARVAVDGDRIQQVLMNLLSNAVKFSPEGGEVAVSVHRRGDRIAVEVTDHGPGIPKEFHGRIFGKFAQADSSDQRQRDGTGLGLSISKAIVERHDGEIGFRTESGVGTTFFFELPALCEPAEAPEADDGQTESDGARVPARMPGGRSGEQRPRILHVEDDADLARVVGATLQPIGEVVLAPSVAEARAVWEHGSFDIVLLDIGLPDGSGLDLLPTFGGRGPAVPIVVFSAIENDAAEHAAVSAALVKSRTSNGELVATITTLLRERSTTAALASCNED